VRELAIVHGDSRLAGRLHQPSESPRAAVVVAHGLASSMASNKLTTLCQALAAAGCMALQFDHSGCGQSPGDPFATSLSIRRDELLAAAGYLDEASGGLPLAYVGSSMGGAAAMAAADILPPACLAVWSAPSDLEELFSRLGQDPEAARYRQLRRDAARHDLEAVMARLSRLLVVHGEADEVVPVAQARRAHRLALEPKRLLLLPGADHQLTRSHDQEQALAATLDWVGRWAGVARHIET